MHRIDGPGATVDNLFTQGNPSAAVPATTVTDEWLNAIQEELVSVIEAAGILLDKPQNNQLLTALQTIAQQKVSTMTTLRGIAPVGTRRIYLAAYDTDGDGGHGVFRAVTGAAPGTFVHNGGTIVVPDGGDGSAAWVREYRGPVNMRWFGAKGDGINDDTSAIQNAINAWPAILADHGTYKITDTLTIPGGRKLWGVDEAVTFTIAADAVAMRVVGSGARLGYFSLTKAGAHTKNGLEIGTNLLSGGRAVIESVSVSGMGQDGISIRNGNLGAIRNVTSMNNGRDGVHFGIETVDNNGWSMEGFNDLANNGRDGLNIESGASKTDAYASKSHQLRGIVAQSNARYGVYCGTRTNIIRAYAEANGAGQVYLDTYASGNDVSTVEGAVTDNGTYNQISLYNVEANYWRGSSVGSLKIPGGGNALTDPYTIDHYIESLDTPIWTPTVGVSAAGNWNTGPIGLTIVGTPTLTGRFIKVGRFVQGSIRIQSTTSTANPSSMTAYIQVGFLFGNSAQAVVGTCAAVNTATGASYGNGLVGSRMYFPSWPASADVTVTFQLMTDS